MRRKKPAITQIAISQVIGLAIGSSNESSLAFLLEQAGHSVTNWKLYFQPQTVHRTDGSFE